MYLNVTWPGIIDPISGEEIPGGDVDCTELKDLSFAPQADLTGNTLPVNEYTVDVITTEDIPFLQAYCRLYDDRNKLWSAWPVRTALRVSEKCVRVTAASWLYDTEYIQLEEKMYTGQTAEAAIAECFGSRTDDYVIGNAIKSKTVSGYAPAQTGRERLTWLLFVLGAYVLDVNRENAAIISVDSTETLIPLERTFVRPTVSKAKWVTGLKITTYDFHQAATEAEWQADNQSYMFPLPWLATSLDFELSNPLAPSDAPENIVEIDNLYLINAGNVSDIATRLTNYWFNNTEVQLDCVNNREYKPGDLVTAYTGAEALVTGFIQQASFAFGLQARSTLRLIGAEQRPSDTLTINYLCDGKRVSQARYRLPVGFAFSINNPYLDLMQDGHRVIYRPTTDKAIGTMVEGGVTVNVTVEVALDLYQGVLYVISVDEVTETQATDGTMIGVIS